jgi:hypothetical protein
MIYTFPTVSAMTILTVYQSGVQHLLQGALQADLAAICDPAKVQPRHYRLGPVLQSQLLGCAMLGELVWADLRQVHELNDLGA